MSQQFQQRPQDEEEERRSRPSAFVVIGSLVVGALIIGSAIVVPNLLDAANATAVSGDVYLEPASSVADLPYSATPLVAAPANAAPLAASTAPAAHQYTAIRTADGGTVGMYGGSYNEHSCDIAQQVAFLKANPGKAKAWIDALNTDPTVKWPGGKLKVTDLASYFATLTPADVHVDTWVTDHGWQNNTFTSYRAILQKDTSALIDKYGVFRARCICGNPLTIGTPASGKITLKNRAWNDFDITKVVSVKSAAKPKATFQLVGADGKVFVRTAGSSGTDAKTDQTAPTTLPTTAPSTGASTAPTTAPSTDASTAPPVSSSTPSASTPAAAGTPYNLQFADLSSGGWSDPTLTPGKLSTGGATATLSTAAISSLKVTDLTKGQDPDDFVGDQESAFEAEFTATGRDDIAFLETCNGSGTHVLNFGGFVGDYTQYGPCKAQTLSGEAHAAIDTYWFTWTGKRTSDGTTLGLSGKGTGTDDPTKVLGPLLQGIKKAPVQ